MKNNEISNKKLLTETEVEQFYGIKNEPYKENVHLTQEYLTSN